MGETSQRTMNLDPARAGDNPKIVFFERTPFMSVELLDLLADYQIVCYDDDTTYKLLKADWNLSFHHATEPPNGIGNDKAVEVMLEDKDFLNKVIRGKERSRALIFYMNRKMDQLLKSADIPMLLPAYEIQERLGNKLCLAGICEVINIAANREVTERMLGRPDEIFAECQSTLGLPFVVQGALGVSGEDTFLVGTEDELLEAMKVLPEGFKATKYIADNIPVSVHACVLDDEIIVRGPFLQLVGLPELSADPFQFAGNDTNQSLFGRNIVERVRDMSHRIGEHVRSEGYRGILGIDFLWDKDTDVVHPQELNTRLVGLTRLLTGIQKDQSIFPDILRHAAAFGVSSFSGRAAQMRLGEIDLSGHGYSHVIIYNNSLHDVVVTRHIEPSIYQVQDGLLRRVRSSLFMQDMEDDDVMIAYTPKEGRALGPAGMLARILLKKSVVRNGQYRLDRKAVELVELVRRRITDAHVQE